MKNIFSWFERNRDWGIFLLRLFIGFRLIYGVQDNILNWNHMLKFSQFLTQFHFPFPMISAVVSVYLQLIAGILVILGLGIRYAALLMIANFTVALLMIHRYDSIEAMTPALSILFCCILFLFLGAGRISLDKNKATNDRSHNIRSRQNN